MNKLNFLKYKIILFLIILSLVFSIVYAHVEQEVKKEGFDIEDYIESNILKYLLIASIIIIISVLISIFYKQKTETIKTILILGIIIPTILVTVFLAGSTIYLNVVSDTKGPVHWHADYEIWNCGEKVDLIKPEGFSNRVGTPLFHDHGDNRIHVEGVVVDKRNADLHTFFNVLGGGLSDNYLSIPTDNEVVEANNGDLCNGKEGKLQVFLFKINNPDDTKSWIYQQQKLEDFEDYVLSPYSQIPPGDCIIIEFDEVKEKTENICETYKNSIQKGELSGG